MFFNTRSIFTATLVTLLASGVAARAVPEEMKAFNGDITELLNGHAKRTALAPPTELVPITHPAELTTGQKLKRDTDDNTVFDPSSASIFYWGSIVGDHTVVASLNLENPDDDEFIIPIEKFAQKLKSLSCGTKENKVMTLQFVDKDTFEYAKSAWDWVNKKDINKFTVVTQPDQCYKGDNRSPYLVSKISFDDATLTALLDAEEKEWDQVVQQAQLKVIHEYIDRNTANSTHTNLVRRGDVNMDLTHSFDGNIFKFDKTDALTSGLGISADATIKTGGSIIADFDIVWTKPKVFGLFKSPVPIPTDAKMTIHPQGVNALFELRMDADGKLGKALDWTLTPEIEIPVGALNVKGLLQVGPFVTLGVHFGSTALEGTAQFKVGATATIDDSASVNVQLLDASQNGISNWTPKFDKVGPEYSAEISGNLKAWVELGVSIKVEALKWGAQAGIDAQLPYFEASLAAKADNVAGVCGTDKVKGIDLGANVGINVNLNAGKVNEAPAFKKDLFNTSWQLLTTCMPVGTATTTAIQTPESTIAEEPTPTITDAPLMTGVPTGMIGTGTGSASGFPMTAGNSTFLRMARRKPTALYNY